MSTVTGWWVSRCSGSLATLAGRTWRRRAIIIASALVACMDVTAPDQEEFSDDGSARYLFSDASTGGGTGFYFLPPKIGKKESYSGTLDASLLPQLQVKVCELPSCSSDVAVFTSTSSPAIAPASGTGFQLNWQTRSSPLTAGVDYRLGVYATTSLSGVVLLGFVDIAVVDNSKALKSVAPDMFGLVKDGNLNVRFRVETGFVASVEVTPSTSSRMVGETQEFVATVLDLHDAALSTASWSTSDPGVATINATNGLSTTATAVSGGTAYIKVSSGGLADSAALTVVSEVAPSVSSTTPANQATGIVLDSNIGITFNEAVNVNGEWFGISCTTSGVRNVAATAVTGGPTGYTINPTADFAPGETCTVTVNAAQVTDQDSDDPPDAMTGNHVFSFSTSDIAPTVLSTTPADAATGVSPSATITVNFSESVNATTASFTLTCDASPVSFGLSSSPSASFTLTPTSPLPGGAACSATVVAAQVTDADAIDPPDQMAADYTFGFTVQVPSAGPDAKDDTFSTSASVTLNGNVFANNSGGADELGSPAAAVSSFGGGSAGGTVETNAPGASVALAGGTLTIGADGALTLTNPATPGVYTVLYRLTNTAGSDDATVTITVQLGPDAKDDTFAMLVGATLNGDVTADNSAGADVLGTPAAEVASFGAGSLSGDAAANAAGASVSLAGGSLTVNANGTFSLAAPTSTGSYTFQYRLTNSVGSDDATVTITVSQPPDAKDDAFVVAVAGSLSENVTSDNGSGADALGFPAATAVSFGGGSLSGDATTNSAGASVSLAGGTLSIASTGAITLTSPTTAGVYTILYRLSNAGGFDDATVTIEVQGPPVPENDGPGASSTPGDPYHGSFNTLFSLSAPGLLSNDNLGVPAGVITSFGGGSVSAAVTDNAAGSPVALASGGSITVNADGSVSFTPPTGFTGLFTFSYRVTNAAGSGDATATIAVGARPSAVNDTYSPTLVGNVAINTATSTMFNVLTNDGGDGRTAVLVSATNGTAVVASAGTFSFSPTPGYEGSASITYKVVNGFGDSPSNATVSLTVGQPIWFVNAGAGAGGTGTLASPFNCLTGAGCASAAARDADDAIFLYSGAYVGGITLQANERLIGQGATASLSSIAGHTWPADAGAEPAMSGAAPTITTSAAATNGISLGTGNRLRGFNLGNSTGSALSGSSFGTLAISEVGINTTGQALDLTTGTLSGSLAGLTSTGGTNNVLLSGIGTSGTFAVNSGALSGSTGDAFKVLGGSGSFTYGGSITNGANRAVSISSRASGDITLSGNITETGTGLLVNAVTGGTVTFSGATKSISTGTNAGVTLTNNSGGTINFTNGGVGITTTSGAAFTATGGGTISVQTGANANTLASTTGTALNVQNTTIGASGLTFRSISANGGANGIVLVSTGSQGLQVTGDGSTHGSGGTIQSATGADGAVAGNGIYLENAANVHLSWMNLSGTHQNHAIRGTGVVGFTMNRVRITGTSGNNASVDEGAVSFTNLTGSASITSSYIEGGFEDNVRVFNSSGTLNSLVMTSDTLGHNGTNGNSSVLLDAAGTAVLNATVQNSRFTGSRSTVISYILNGGSSGNVVVSSNVITNNHANKVGSDFGIYVASTSSAAMTYQVSGNSVNGAGGSGIEVDRLAGGGGAMTGSITANTVGTSGSANSGSAASSTIVAGIGGAGTAATHTVTISGNTLRQFTNYGIRLINRGTGTGYLNATVMSNNIAEPSPNSVSGMFPTTGIRAELGASSGPPADDGKTCLDIGSNTVNQTGTSLSAEIRVFGRFSTKTSLLGLGQGGASPDPNTYLNNKNTITVASGGFGAVNATSTLPFQSSCPPI